MMAVAMPRKDYRATRAGGCGRSYARFCASTGAISPRRHQPPTLSQWSDLNLVGGRRPLSAIVFSDFEKVDLGPQGGFHLEAIDEAIEADPAVKVLHVQRSCGYRWRPSLPIQEIERYTETSIAVAGNSCSRVFLYVVHLSARLVDGKSRS